MIINDNFKDPELLIAELKTKGLKNKEIAVQVFPDLPIKSAIVKVSRYLNRGTVTQYLTESREQALIELKVNWRELLEVYTEASHAVKTVVHGKDEDSWVEVVPDHTTRMIAVKELVKLMPDKELPQDPLQDIDLTGMDTIELTRNSAVFKRTE